MNRSESKYFHTAARMDEALLALLETKDLAYITVKEICAQAGVNRSTFYLHYETIADLLEESVEHMNAQFLSYMQQHDPVTFLSRLRDCPLEELYLITPEYLTPYLSYVREHRRLFRTAVENAASLRLERSYRALLQHVLTPILERFHVAEADRDYLLSFYIHGLMAVINTWLKQDCADSVEHIASVMMQCVQQPHNHTKTEKNGLFTGRFSFFHIFYARNGERIYRLRRKILPPFGGPICVKPADSNMASAMRLV